MAIAAQSCGLIVGPQTVPLEIVAEKHGDADAVTDETPARQDRGREFRAAYVGVAQHAGGVVINAAAEQELEHGSLLVETRGRPEHAAMGEASVPPEIGRREKQEPGGVLAELARRVLYRCRPGKRGQDVRVLIVARLLGFGQCAGSRCANATARSNA
jgi:hypothetical protein